MSAADDAQRTRVRLGDVYWHPQRSRWVTVAGVCSSDSSNHRGGGACIVATYDVRHADGRVRPVRCTLPAAEVRKQQQQQQVRAAPMRIERPRVWPSMMSQGFHPS